MAKREVGKPKQRTEKDLHRKPSTLKRRLDDKQVHLQKGPATGRSPDDIMRSMGFAPTATMNPLQFLIAVMNNDLEKIYNMEIALVKARSKGGIALNYRVDAAKTAARYIHMEMPKTTIDKSDEAGGLGMGLLQAMAEGNARLNQKALILETIQQMSPDMPLPAASYPPTFGQIIEHEPATDEGDDE
jgi:hypothetical protein